MLRKPISTHTPSGKCSSSCLLRAGAQAFAGSLYGTRDAPSLREMFAASQLEGLGFIRGLASSCVLRHASRDLVAVVHGDDFVFAGVDVDLAWVHCALEKSILLKKVGTLSGDAGGCARDQSPQPCASLDSVGNCLRGRSSARRAVDSGFGPKCITTDHPWTQAHLWCAR